MASRAAPLIALVETAAEMGGVEFSTLYLAEALDLSRFRRVVICPTEGPLPTRCRERGIPVLIQPRPRLYATTLQMGRGYLLNPVAWLVNGVNFWRTAFQLAALFKAQGVALVCTKGLYAHFYGGLAAWLSGLPCVWHVQDLVSARARWLYAAVLGGAGRWLAREVIADGTPIAAQLAPYVPRARLQVIHNGVDTTQFAPTVDGTAVRAEWGVAIDEVLVGHVARLTRWKGQDYLVRAFAALAADFPRAKLVLVGTPVFDTDTFANELQQLVQDLGLCDRVIFAGYRWDLPQVLAALDIFAHPSIEKDTSPLAVVSALAAGKPIVVTQVPGVAELFNPGVDGLLAAPADVPTLLAVLRQLLSDAALRHRLGQAARATAEAKLSLPHFARQCEAVFARALDI